MRILILLFLLSGSCLSSAAPQNYLFLLSGQLSAHTDALKRSDIEGAQVVYTWRQLEPEKGRYDFTSVRGDLLRLQRLHKQLFIQLQDRFFSPGARDIPDYLLQMPEYGGGLIAQTDHPGQGKREAQGWVAMQWEPALRNRYQKLLQALAREFDGQVAGINLPESAIDIDATQAVKTGFTCERYFSATVENMLYAHRVFTRSYVVQYVNFWPCEWNNDHHFMGRIFALAAQHRIGLGGPDIVPWKKTQMKNAYPFFHRYRGHLPLVAMAVQDPTLTYTRRGSRKKFEKADFVSFAGDYLGADIIFWTPRAPWLQRASGVSVHGLHSDG